MKNANIVTQSAFIHVVNFTQNERDRKFPFRDFTEKPDPSLCDLQGGRSGEEQENIKFLLFR